MSPDEKFLVCEITDQTAGNADDDLRHRLRVALLARAYDGTEAHHLIRDPAVRRAIAHQYGATITIDAAVEKVMLLIERGVLR
jgi:hypothetical protein